MLLSEIAKIVNAELTIPDRNIEHFCFRKSLLKENCLYFAIVTEGFNGYDIDFEIIKQLNSVVISDKQIEDVPCIIVENPVKAMYQLAQYLRTLYTELKTVALVGYRGKSSVKNMLNSVLKEENKKVLFNTKSNSTRELCGLIFDLDNETKYLAMELGLSYPNMPFVAASGIMRPNVVIIPNVANSYMDNFENDEQVLENILSVTSAMKEDGILFLNGDESVLYNAEYKSKKVFYGMENSECDFLACNIENTPDGVSFNIKTKDGVISEQKFSLKTYGKYNILNALAVYVVAKHFGLSDEEIAKKFENYQSESLKNSVLKGYQGNIIISDCYDATPQSTLTNFETLKNIPCSGRKIAILGDMTYLKDKSEELHKEIGRKLNSYYFNIVLTYGLNAEYIYKEIINTGRKALHFYSKYDLIIFLKKFVKPDDVLLFNGSEKINDFQKIFSGFNDQSYKFEPCEYVGSLGQCKSCYSDADSMYFWDSTGQQYIGKNINQRITIRDLTILFAIIPVIELANLEDNVTISEFAESKYVEGSSVKLNKDDVFSLKGLIYLAILQSSFEAVFALIEHVFGKYKNFEKYMDAKFEDLGMYDTQIGTISHKINKYNYTSAYDVYMFLKYAMQYELFKDIIDTKEFTLNNQKTGEQIPIKSNNKLLFTPNYYLENAYSIKAENDYNMNTTRKSLISCLKRESGYVIGVILGSDDFQYCNNSYIDMKRILQVCANGENNVMEANQALEQSLLEGKDDLLIKQIHPIIVFRSKDSNNSALKGKVQPFKSKLSVPNISNSVAKQVSGKNVDYNLSQKETGEKQPEQKNQQPTSNQNINISKTNVTQTVPLQKNIPNTSSVSGTSTAPVILQPEINIKTPNKKTPVINYIAPFCKKFTVGFWGDFIGGENYQAKYDEEFRINVLRQYGYHWLFEKISPIMKRFDMNILNLETPLTALTHSDFEGTKDDIHWSDKSVIPQILKYYNVGAVSLGNNHILDYGKKGLQDTLHALNSAGIYAFGAGMNMGSAKIPLVKHFECGFKSANLYVIGGYRYKQEYEEEFDFYAGNKKEGVFQIDELITVDLIKSITATDKNSIIVVYPHFGFEGTKTSQLQRNLAHAYIDAGADFIIGHGSNFINSIEEYNGKNILYGLGNCVFPKNLEGKMFAYSMAAELEFNPDGKIKLYVYPLYMENNSYTPQTRPITKAELGEFMTLMVEGCEELQYKMKIEEHRKFIRIAL